MTQIDRFREPIIAWRIRDRERLPITVSHEVRLETYTEKGLSNVRVGVLTPRGTVIDIWMGDELGRGGPCIDIESWVEGIISAETDRAAAAVATH